MAIDQGIFGSGKLEIQPNGLYMQITGLDEIAPKKVELGKPLSKVDGIKYAEVKNVLGKEKFATDDLSGIAGETVV